MKNKKYHIIITSEYKEDMKDIRKIFSKKYYNQLREISKMQIADLQYMPRMYQKLYTRDKLERRI